MMDIGNLTNLDNISSIKSKNSLNHLKALSNNLNEADEKQFRKLSKDFESIFLKQLLDVSMKESTFAGEGAGKEIIKGMYTDQLSQTGSGNFGFSGMIYDYLVQQSQSKQVNMKAMLAQKNQK
jgi:Rod binding domain-containing protein